MSNPISVTELGMLMVCRESTVEGNIILDFGYRVGNVNGLQRRVARKSSRSDFRHRVGNADIGNGLFTPNRIVPVSSRIRFGSVMVIMDLVFAKVKNNKMIL